MGANDANPNLYPIDPALMLVARLQTDLRTVDTARTPSTTLPVLSGLAAFGSTPRLGCTITPSA